MKKYDLIYFAGDSWTVALNTDNVLKTPMLETQGFPFIVSDHLKIPYIKKARGGAGNTWIHREVYKDIPELHKKYKKILSVVGWSHPQRVEIFSNNFKDIHNISSPPFSKEFHMRYCEEACDFELKNYEENTILYIKSLRALYHAYKVDYIDAFAFSNVLHVPFIGHPKVLEENYLDICGDEGRIYNPATSGYGHQNILGNEKIAKALLNAIHKYYG